MPTQKFSNGAGQCYLTVRYDAANHWVLGSWSGFQAYSCVLTGSEACLQELSKHECPYLLNDSREVVGAWDQAVGWLVIDWAPRAKALGVTHIAHVLSLDPAAARSAETLDIGIDGSIHFQTFGSIDEAQTWLREAHQQRVLRSEFNTDRASQLSE